MNKSSLLTAERLRELLHYDHETGVFTRLVSRPHSKAGDVAGYLNNQGYHKIRIDYRDYQIHRLVWLWAYGSWPVESLDHINGIRSDNRLCNLREVTNAQNSQNMRTPHSDSKSGMLGVGWHKASRKWVARIMVGGKPYHLGQFPTAELAHTAYLSAKRELHPMGTL